jgi:hypothetical protein
MVCRKNIAVIKNLHTLSAMMGKNGQGNFHRPNSIEQGRCHPHKELLILRVYQYKKNT